jgi:hypothetical protein
MYLAVWRQCCESRRKIQPSDLKDLKIIMRIWRGKIPTRRTADEYNTLETARWFPFRIYGTKIVPGCLSYFCSLR